jgi:hypothetical protein
MSRLRVLKLLIVSMGGAMDAVTCTYLYGVFNLWLSCKCSIPTKRVYVLLRIDARQNNAIVATVKDMSRSGARGYIVGTPSRNL